MNIMKSINRISSLFLVIILMAQTGCEKEWLTENPLSELSEVEFWKTADDALLALTGVYQYAAWNGSEEMGHARPFSWATDEGRFKTGLGIWTAGQFFEPTESYVVTGLWQYAYRNIYRCNYFLENIEKVTMDAAKKKEYIAEVRFLRAKEYFWLGKNYGGVPLVTKVLTPAEANSQTRNTRQEIVDFTLTELTAAAPDLPATRPAGESGRVIKAAALTFKGRLLMIEKRWSEAAAAFKEIMDLGVHVIHPDFKGIFLEANNLSKEIIYSLACVEGTTYDNRYYQRNRKPGIYGGYDEQNIYQEQVDAFLMTDGLPIEESPLYDPANPFANRDPRLYETTYLPGYTIFNGTLYEGHPDKVKGNFGIKALVGATGYHCKKYNIDNWTGNVWHGGDYIYIRYPEVLLSYLESKLEAGDAISQALLDQTINLVRTRPTVNMPAVTETDPAKLRQIVRRERQTELANEPHIRFMDLNRWGLWPACMERKFHGMKLTDDPANYTAYPVEKTGPYAGHLISWDRTGHFKSNNILMPIPQYERDINPALEQNPGY